MKHLQSEITYMTTPTLEFEEIKVNGPSGEAIMPGPHKWSPVTIAVKYPDEFLTEVAFLGGIFNILFVSGKRMFKLTDCKLQFRDMQSPERFIVTIQHALITEDE